MFRGRGGRGGRRQGAPAHNAKGLFADNIWHCDCQPRLPAEHFKVKKEGKNQGRWFYTCQNSQDSGKRCGFFLWEEDAQPRMEAAILAPKTRTQANERHINDPTITGNGLFASHQGQPSRSNDLDDDGDTVTASPSPSPRSRQDKVSTTGTKRNANDAGLDNEDFLGSLSDREERELARVADAAAPSTPQKAQKTGVYATPATTTKRKLPWLDSEPSMKTSKSNDLFHTPSGRRSSVSSLTETLGRPTEPQTPLTLAVAKESPAISSHRYKDALKNPADSQSSLTSEALATLASVSIPTEALSNLRGVLSRHDFRTQGVTKGRDISRLALKAKDAKIAELQARIASLEAEREFDKGMLRKLRWEMEQSGQAMDDEL